MELSCFDLLLTWDDIETFMSRSKHKNFTVESIYPKDGNIVANGNSRVGDWSVSIEPKESNDGKFLYLQVKDYNLQVKTYILRGVARLGLKAFKNLNPLNWWLSDKEYLVKMCAMIINFKYNGVQSEKERLRIDLASFLSAIIKTSVKIGVIKLFRLEDCGLHIVIEGKKSGASSNELRTMQSLAASSVEVMAEDETKGRR